MGLTLKSKYLLVKAITTFRISRKFVTEEAFSERHWLDDLIKKKKNST